MRILAFTDPHGEMAAARSVLAMAKRESPDLVLCSGDVTLFDSVEQGFFEALREIGKPVYFIPGNHDSPDETRRMRDLHPFLVDVSFCANDLGPAVVAGVPGNDLAFWPGPSRGEEETFELVMAILKGSAASKPMIFLAHYPPSRTAIDGSQRYTPDAGGSRLVRRIVEAARPALVISGHYHGAFGVEDAIGSTRVVNPGPSGRCITIDGT